MNVLAMSRQMNDVQRLAPQCEDSGNGAPAFAYMNEDPLGSFVRYTDYAALQQQLAAAREELAITRASLEARNEQLAGCESALGAAWEDAAKAREAEADAARYRAMRHAGWGKGASRDLWFDILRAETPDQLDAAINATLQRDRQP